MAALVVVDVQGDFINGTLAVPDARDILPVVVSLLKAPQWRWRAVVASQDYHPPNHISFARGQDKVFEKATRKSKDGIEYQQMMWPEHCVQGSPGAELHADISAALPPGDSGRLIVVQKGTDPLVEAYSAMTPSLDQQLKTLHVDELVVVGLATDYCVRHTVLDALHGGYAVVVVRDAVRGVTDHQAALDEMAAGGARIMNVDGLAAHLSPRNASM